MNENGTPRGPGATGDADRGGERGGAPRLRDVSDLHEFDDVKRAYRALDDEPVPPALDASVLDAARAAVRPQRAKPRWLVPASIAATVLLAVGVSLDVRREASREDTATLQEFSPADDAGRVDAAPAAAPVAAPEPAAVPGAAKSNAAPPAEYAQSAPARREAFPASPPPPAAVAPPAFAPPPHVSAAPIVADVPAAAPMAPPSEERADAALREIARARTDGALAAKAVAADRNAAAAGASVREAPAAPPPPIASAVAPPVAAQQSSSAERRKSEALQRTPEQWLQDIEALRRAGRTADADAEMARFRAAYPDYPPR